MKICFHVDEVERWDTCMANVFNTLIYFESHAVDGALMVIANSAAVAVLTKEGAERAGIAEDLKNYIDKGVVIKACANALKGKNIEPEELLPGISVVSAGIIELANMQAEGFAYIRP